ncbi:hypothetical protein LVJ82_03485 [Vitreoscilla massiliensis]|uniref:CN hydrolase domain-containing protein n=1 Tax=Vitreoscilla massiliensis TaxID=1689272 RepID=A0ABY4E3V6_9NEIS|nr:nitrilase-related carbon-nitrogen hydrolase [Vitreoscilla massiliensis]UOO90065.1 hypothetical protein LVJ82_03485 [Vitreoscilla massiliensis]
MRPVKVAATQMSGGWDVAANIAKAEALVREAAAQGANIILLQELFERNYFCQKQIPAYLAFATPIAENAAIQHFQALAPRCKTILTSRFTVAR